MRYYALACDYDGTLAHHGRVDQPTLDALERLLGTGRQLVLVTGRELEELKTVFPPLHLFTYVVAENGALLYRPSTGEIRTLIDPPPPSFAQTLCKRGVNPVSTGHVIVATWRPHEKTVLEVIHDAGLELQVIFNKEAVMVLPSGVNKATGLSAALKAMGLTRHEVVGVGDAENDHAFLRRCECSVAVANALPSVKEECDWVTEGDHGAGVTELIDALIEDDLARLEARLTRHNLLLGTGTDGEKVELPPYGRNLLIAGPSGSGKSTAATSFLERLIDHGYQFCILDPEGDYENLEGAVTLGGRQGLSVEEVLKMLATSRDSLVVNLVGLPLADRPPFLLALLPRLLQMRARTGRPHWLVIDEAHHLLPASWEPGPQVLPRNLKRALFITVHPELVSPGVLASIDAVMAVGKGPETTIAQFCAVLGEQPPRCPTETLEAGDVLFWSKDRGDPRKVRVVPSRSERRRHTRKYAEGELPPDRSFYFRGPEGKLNLRAQNLITFLQLGEGVDDDTWLHHLRQGDYSRWFRERIKDEHLATRAEQVEKRNGITAAESRALIKAAVEQDYTLPAGPPLPMPGTDAEPGKKIS